MPGMNIAQMFAQNQGNEFSGNYNNYQPSLRPMQANPLASGVQQGNPKGSATLGGIDAAMAKRGSQDNNAQRLSSAGESSGVKFKHDDAGHATGSSAFDTLDGYMKKAGLNSFQTQFFSRMIESGMPAVMVEAAIKTAGDRFGAEVQAELQDGHEKLAGPWWFELAKGAGKFGTKLFGKPAQKATAGLSRAVPSAPAAQPTKLYRAAQGLGNAYGSESLKAVGQGGLKEGIKTYGKNFMPGVTGRALTGGIYGATDPGGPLGGGDESMLTNIGKGVATSVFGGPMAQNMQRRSFAAGTAGGTLDLLGATDGLGEKARYLGLAPTSLSKVPGLANMGNRAAKVADKNLAGKAYDFVLNKPLSTGFGESMKGRSGPFDMADPFNAGFHWGGKGVNKVYSKFKPQINAVIGQPARAATAGFNGAPAQAATGLRKAVEPAVSAANSMVSTPARAAATIGVPTLGGVAYGVNRVNDAADNTEMLATDAHEEVVNAADKILAQANTASNTFNRATNDVSQTLQDPGFLKQVAVEVIKDPEVQEKTTKLMSGAFGQFMQNTGSGVLDAVKNMFGEEAAAYLENNWPMLLAGTIGIGGGALMGGAGGAMLGGFAAPLALMLAQQSGMFNPQQQEPSTNPNETAAQATNLTGNDTAGRQRSELVHNSADDGNVQTPAPVVPAVPAPQEDAPVQAAPQEGVAEEPIPQEEAVETPLTDSPDVSKAPLSMLQERSPQAAGAVAAGADAGGVSAEELAEVLLGVNSEEEFAAAVTAKFGFEIAEKILTKINAMKNQARRDSHEQNQQPR